MKTLTERTTAALSWLDAQLAICNAATKGPYQVILASPDNELLTDIVRSKEGLVLALCQNRPEHLSNAAFIVAARTGYPAMLEGMKVAIECLQLIASKEPDETKAKLAAHFSLDSILTKIESLQ